MSLSPNNSLSVNSARGIDTAKKVPLGPGRSLMDWIRNAPKRTPRATEITEEELANHNSEKDCWLAVRDVVYDVTAYIAYHPGGRDQIMRGAGIDATALFNKYHPWVNVENMLKTCIVGKLSFMKSSFKMPFAMNSLTATSSLPREAFSKPFFDWMQDDKFVRLFVTINQQDVVIRKEHVTLLHEEETNELHVYVFIEQNCYSLGYKLSSPVKSISFDLEKNKNVKINLEKVESTSWKNVGSALKDNKSFHKTELVQNRKFPVYLTEKVQINHDCYLFTFQHSPKSIARIPIGRHVHILLPNNQSLIRPYTPVPKSVASKAGQDGKETTFLVKIYKDGMFTPSLESLSIGDKVLMSLPEGLFDLSVVNDAVTITLFAAGTGITPMLGIIHYCMFEQFLELRTVKLIFFNKTEEDIVLRREMQSLALKFPRNFSITNVLSNPPSTWEGESGRISDSLVKQVAPEIAVDNDSLERNEVLYGVCGPKAFTDLAVEILKKLNVPSSSVFPFRG